MTSSMYLEIIVALIQSAQGLKDNLGSLRTETFCLKLNDTPCLSFLFVCLLACPMDFKPASQVLDFPVIKCTDFLE